MKKENIQKFYWAKWDELPIRKAAGRVRSGVGDLSQRMVEFAELYADKTGIRCFPGSLNVELPSAWSVPADCIRIEPGEGGCRPGVSIVPCKINDRTAFVVRTDLVESGLPTYPDIHPKIVVEIICDVKLRDEFGLADGDTVNLELIETV